MAIPLPSRPLAHLDAPPLPLPVLVQETLFGNELVSFGQRCITRVWKWRDAVLGSKIPAKQWQCWLSYRKSAFHAQLCKHRDLQLDLVFSQGVAPTAAVRSAGSLVTTVLLKQINTCQCFPLLLVKASP